MKKRAAWESFKEWCLTSSILLVFCAFKAYKFAFSDIAYSLNLSDDVVVQNGLFVTRIFVDGRAYSYCDYSAIALLVVIVLLLILKISDYVEKAKKKNAADENQPAK